MTAKCKIIILTAIAAVFLPVLSRASGSKPEVMEQQVVTVTKVLADSTIVEATFTDMEEARKFANDTKSLVPTPAVSPQRKEISHVMVGLELGTGLDLSGSDMSTFNADIIVGYRHKIIQLLGLSVGIHKSLGTRDSFIPIYAVFRTGFSTRPTLMFMHASAGYSFNTIASSPMFGDITATLGVGINLTRRPRFQSNIVFALGFRHFSERHQHLINLTKPNLGFAQISFGISI